MRADGFHHVYGPVPSRRLGRSLGVDLVPFKTCTYDCLYCQLGRTTNKTVNRKEYVPVHSILRELERKLEKGPVPDFISIAGSGEPTLNSGLGNLIADIKGMTKVRVAVLTNGSLLWMHRVRDGLMGADLVLPSLDAGDEHLFQVVNRPHEKISFDRMVDGIETFTKYFPGEVWLEIFLLGGMTGIPSEVEKIVSIIKRIQPARVQLNTVCRPPAEKSALPLSSRQMIMMRDLFPGRVEIIGEGTRNVAVSTLYSAEQEDVLAMLGRRPCTPTDVADGLEIHITEALKILEGLAVAGKLNAVVEGGRRYYTVNERTQERNSFRE